MIIYEAIRITFVTTSSCCCCKVLKHLATRTLIQHKHLAYSNETNKHSWPFFAFPAPTSTTCNFDTGLCNGWRQIRCSDVFDWTHQTGSTGSSGTGPDFDHTSGSGRENAVFQFHLVDLRCFQTNWTFENKTMLLAKKDRCALFHKWFYFVIRSAFNVFLC